MTSFDGESDSYASPYLPPEAARAQAHRWRSAYRRRVLIVDALTLAVVVVFAEWVGARPDNRGLVDFSQATVFALCVYIGWLLALEYAHSRDLSLVGFQTEEYSRVMEASGWTFSLAAAFYIFLAAPISRVQFSVTFVLGAISLLLARHFLRADVRRRRSRGRYISRVVALGEVDAGHALSEYFGRSPGAGYKLIGLCTPDSDEAVGTLLPMPTGAVPFLGFKDPSELESILQAAGADALAVVFSERLGPGQIANLAWRMQAVNIELIVVPGMAEVAAHRLHLRPLENLPLFVIGEPTHDASSMVTKRILDIVLASVALLVALPVIALAGLAIKLEDRGPVFYRQKRVGLAGETFSIIKLRSMYVGTDATPQPEQHRHGSIFHKRTSDSCVTRVGKFLRATSIDELPQLFNVLQGSMSIVGPRPLAVGEAGSAEDFIEHRQQVKPGMTGLWQVSGRSDLADKDRIRLDDSYAGNWSVIGDLLIIWRTVGAVLQRKGAF